MKSVLQAVNQITVAFGNIIVIIVAEAKLLDYVSFIQLGAFSKFQSNIFTGQWIIDVWRSYVIWYGIVSYIGL